jgi:hypothetical protein
VNPTPRIYQIIDNTLQAMLPVNPSCDLLDANKLLQCTHQTSANKSLNAHAFKRLNVRRPTPGALVFHRFQTCLQNPGGSKRACKIMFQAPHVHSIFRFSSLSVLNLETYSRSIKYTKERFAIAMERLFSPCTRLYDILGSQGGFEDFRRRHPEPLQELSLDVSTEELLNAERSFAFADLYALLGSRKTIAWLTPHAAVVRVVPEGAERVESYWHFNEESYCFYFTVDGKAIVAYAHSHEHFLEICDVIL